MAENACHPQDDKTAVACSRVLKEFQEGETQSLVLRGVDLNIPLGKMTLLAGPSGCGKTTLLSVIGGLLNRTGGSLSVLGTDPDALGETERVLFRRANIGFIFQQYHLLPALDATENAAVPLLVAGLSRRVALERAGDLLAKLGLKDREHAFPSHLSGGQQQRVAIARALIHDPRLVLCDEPTAALDARSGHAVMEMLAAVAVNSARAVVVVTHDSRVFEFADVIAHLNDGRIERVQQPIPSRWPAEGEPQT